MALNTKRILNTLAFYARRRTLKHNGVARDQATPANLPLLLCKRRKTTTMLKQFFKSLRDVTHEQFTSKRNEQRLPPDFDDLHIRIIESVQDYTMTSPERIFALVEAVRYLTTSGTRGSFVECGVWRGGSTMAMALSLANLGDTQRELYLFDTFAGMSKPTDADVAHDGEDAVAEFENHQKSDGSSDWCHATLDDVQTNVFSTNYPPSRFHFQKGKVEDTIPKNSPLGEIALLRLDTDWYESTKHELEHLYPKLQSGGILIVDDYGHWQGARKAVDEYIAENDINLMLNRIDYTARIAVKP